MVSDFEPQGERSKRLEDLFFMKEDQRIIEKLKWMRKMQETKESLARVSGIRNDKILQKLVELNVRPETLASLSLIPLVEVAWADGSISEKEKATVIRTVNESGRATRPEDRELLAQWVDRRPSSELLEAWVTYIQGLCEQLSAEEKAQLKKEILGHTQEIAESSGGFLGLGKISDAENAMLKKLATAFE